jgi:hypothetical protein
MSRYRRVSIPAGFWLETRFGLLASFEEMETGGDSATAELSNTDLYLRRERNLF